jgi:hypothetical protein
MLFSFLLCMLTRVSVYTVLNFGSTHVAFVWLYVSWFHIQGVWIDGAICYVIMGNFSCIIGRPILLCVHT